jgi:hypothetical protein
MVKKIFLALITTLYVVTSYSAPNHAKSDRFFHENELTVAMDVAMVMEGVIVGGYQLLRFIKEVFPYQRKLVLAGYSEKDLKMGPLSAFCRTCLEEQTSFNIIGLYDSGLSEDISEEQASVCRKQALSFYNLYQFPVFREIIKKWPEYPEHILKANDDIKYYSKEFRKSLDSVQGFKKGELANYIKDEYTRLMDAVSPSWLNWEGLSDPNNL